MLKLTMITLSITLIMLSTLSIEQVRLLKISKQMQESLNQLVRLEVEKEKLLAEKELPESCQEYSYISHYKLYRCHLENSELPLFLWRTS